MPNLNFKVFGDGTPLVILHGLLGSLDNWQTIARKLADTYRVFIVDQRNHGKSFHSAEFNYEILSDDLYAFFLQHNITQAHVIGHSMGGKAAMLFAMQHPEMVHKLIVVDVAPVAYEDRHSHIFKALQAISLDKMNSRDDVESTLRNKLNAEDESTIQFLMKGLYRDDANAFRWRFNFGPLWDAYNSISGEVNGKPFNGKTLFIKGKYSPYINQESYASIERLFPNNVLEEIEGAGHWVHAEQPEAFLRVISAFLKT